MIRRCYYSLLLLFICFAFAGICIAQDEIENLAQNADFEDFSQAPWTIWVEDPSAVATMSVNKDESLTGEQSLLIDISRKGGGMRVELHQRPFDLKQGQEMTYAFWAKLEKDDVREARMICNHRADPWTSYGSKQFTITEEWQEFWVTFTMPADDDLVGIYVELRDTPGLVWFDHFRFYEGEYIEEDLEGVNIDRAVNPSGKTASTWAGVKIAH